MKLSDFYNETGIPVRSAYLVKTDRANVFYRRFIDFVKTLSYNI